MAKLIPVEFLQGAAPYNRGDVAGFADTEVVKLEKGKLARRLTAAEVEAMLAEREEETAELQKRLPQVVDRSMRSPKGKSEQGEGKGQQGEGDAPPAK